MANFKGSAILSDINGKVGGSIYARNHAGLYVKSTCEYDDRKSDSQQKIRDKFVKLSQNWQLLDEAKRLMWFSEADSYFKKNCFGDKYKRDAFHYYLSCNMNLFFVGEDTISEPINDNQTGDISEFHLRFETYPADALIIDFSGLSTNATTKYLIYSTPCVSAGLYYVKNLYRLIGYISCNTSDTCDITDLWLSVFLTFVYNKKIFCKLRAVNTLSGCSGNTIQNSILT